MLFTNQSMAHPQPFAAVATDFAARKGNFRDHNRPLHTAQVAKLGSAVAVVVVVSAAASAVVAVEVLAQAPDAVGFAMGLELEQVGKEGFVETWHGCTFRAREVVVGEMAEKRNSVHAA
jgi:hypothetical protein